MVLQPPTYSYNGFTIYNLSTTTLPIKLDRFHGLIPTPVGLFFNLPSTPVGCFYNLPGSIGSTDEQREMLSKLDCARLRLGATVRTMQFSSNR